MKNLLTIIAFLCVSPLGVIGQPNIVVNPGFELNTNVNCLSGIAQVGTYCVGWKSLCSSPDYLQVCSGLVPTNNFGYQWPAQGQSYIGLWDFNSSTNYGYRESITGRMVPMQPGATYEISLSVSVANKSAYFTNGLCVHFYDTGLTTISSFTSAPPFIPKVSFSSSGQITDTQNWVRLTALYVADSAYDNIAIGGFLNAASVSYSLTYFSPSVNYVYWYVDSVVVKLYDSLNFDFTDTLLCSGDTINVPYNVRKKKQSNNVFTLQLSNASGSFASPVNVGSRASDTSGIITAVIPSSTSAGTGYKIRIITSNFPDTSYESINIKIGSGPIAKPVANNNGPLCTDDTLKLTASSTTSGVSYSWTGANNFTSGLQNPIINNPLVVHSGNYIVTARLYGCIAKDTTTVVIYGGGGSAGTLAGSNSPVCRDDTMKLFGTASGSGNSYTWTGPNSFTSNQQNPVFPNATAILSGDYILYATNGFCTSRDTVTVVVKPRPENFSAVYNGPLCTGEVINFTASSTSTGVTYAWVGPNSFNSTSATPFIGGSSTVHNGDYIVNATLNGCSLKDTVTVTVKPLPAKPIVNNNGPLCAGATINLTATSTTGVSWSWIGPGSYSSTTQNPNITNSTTAMSGDYIVTTVLNGCNSKDTTTVLIKQVPIPVILSNNGPRCAGDTLKIFSTTSSTGVTYAWGGPGGFTSAAQDTIIANSTSSATGWYKMTVDLNGCTYKDSTNVTVYPIPATPVASYSNPLCVGETLQLSASSVTSASYSWTGANSFSSSSQNPTRTGMQFGDTGTYSVTATVNGCTSPGDNVSVKINPVPFVVILSNPMDSICNGTPVLFTALPNNHGGTPAYQWYVNMQPKTTGVVFSTSTLNNGDIIRCDMTENTKCNAPYKDESNDIQMTVLNWLAPMVSVSANPATPLKPNEYVTFTATPANAGIFPKYQWKRNGQNVVGATSNVWSANTLNDNDDICVEITSNYKCPLPLTATSNCIKVKLLTGIGDINTGNRIVLYPNPNSGKFVVEAPPRLSPKGREVLHLEIINAMGQVLYHDKIVPVNGVSHKEIDLGGVAKGVYMLRLHTDDGVSVIRFNVE